MINWSLLLYQNNELVQDYQADYLGLSSPVGALCI